MVNIWVNWQHYDKLRSFDDWQVILSTWIEKCRTLKS